MFRNWWGLTKNFKVFNNVLKTVFLYRIFYIGQRNCFMSSCWILTVIDVYRVWRYSNIGDWIGSYKLLNNQVNFSSRLYYIFIIHISEFFKNQQLLRKVVVNVDFPILNVLNCWQRWSGIWFGRGPSACLSSRQILILLSVGVEAKSSFSKILL